MSRSIVDILEIDAKIQTSFSEDVKKVSQYKDRLSELEKTCNVPNISSRVKNELMKSAVELRSIIDKIESERELNFYVVETAELLERYRNILKTPIKISFMGKMKENNHEKNEIIQKYLAIAQKYCKVSIKPLEKKFSMECNNCSNKRDFIVEENAYICVDCGSQQDILQHTTSYKDVDRVNISGKYTYDRKVHFRDCINQYQGKQNCSIEQKVYTDLEDIFDRHHLLVGDKNTKKQERFSKITKEHVLMFLKELGYPKHYENVTLIHYNMTGKKPDDISHLEDRLLADFDLLVETYDKHTKNTVDRVNFISTQYVLYQLLQRHKHPCKKEDFVILKTMDRKSFHDGIMRELASHLSWSFQPLY